MSKPSRKAAWFWTIYFLLFFTYNLERLKDFFSPGSDISFYYSFLCAFNVGFFFTYVLNLAQIFINLFHALPLTLYALGLSWGSARFWQYLLASRLIFDLTGHSYEWLSVVALFKTEPRIAFLISIQFLIFYLPSYVACYHYAFKQKQKPR